MPADSVGVDIPAVDLEVEPVESKSLDQTEDSFAEKGVDAVRGFVLKEESYDRVSENQSDKRVGPLGFVLDIHGGEEIEPLDVFLADFGMFSFGPAFDEDEGYCTEEVCDVISMESVSEHSLGYEPRKMATQIRANLLGYST